MGEMTVCQEQHDQARRRLAAARDARSCLWRAVEAVKLSQTWARRLPVRQWERRGADGEFDRALMSHVMAAIVSAGELLDVAEADERAARQKTEGER